MSQHIMGRRQRPRIDFTEAVAVFQQGRRVQPTCRAVDLGEGGVGLKGPSLANDSRVKVQLALPDAQGYLETVELEAIVAWRSLTGSGLRFIEPSRERVEKVKRYVSARLEAASWRSPL